jgi:aldose 1-epimerase
MIARTIFGHTPDGTPVDLFTLKNRHGMEARITNYGGIVVSLTAPDRQGKFADVVLGCEKLADYLNGHPYFGAIIGRYGNRIGKGKFKLDGVEYNLPINNGPNSLHGGVKGFDKVIWAATPLETADGPALQLSYYSRDGEEGYPGNLSVIAIYSVTEDNALKLDFSATTDKKTLCNLTHHSYFNLAGKGDVLSHVVQINADTYTPVDGGLIPTGELLPVAHTPLDFRKPVAIGSRIDSDHDQIKLGAGYDHNWVLNHRPGELGLAAIVEEPRTGRTLEVWTTAPGTQFYTGNFLDGKVPGKGGCAYHRRHGFCFEPQYFPDSPNQPAFPPAELSPGETYRNTILYKFGVK